MENADALSRLPLPEHPAESDIPSLGDVHLVFQHLADSVATATHIRKWTEKDPTLSRVHHFILHGWPDVLPNSSFKTFFNHRTELSAVDGCILRGAKVVIPPEGQSLVLSQLHDTHPGICKMKNLARAYVWWPKIDTDIVTTVQQCDICQVHRPLPQRAPLHPWEWPSRPWSRVHIDHAGPFQ